MPLAKVPRLAFLLACSERSGGDAGLISAGRHRADVAVMSQDLLLHQAARDAPIAAFLAGVSHAASGFGAARPQSRNSAMPTFSPAVLG